MSARFHVQPCRWWSGAESSVNRVDTKFLGSTFTGQSLTDYSPSLLMFISQMFRSSKLEVVCYLVLILRTIVSHQ